MQHTNLYIDGQWRDAASGERFDVINPATEETIASVASADLADADAALDAAQAAFGLWAAKKPRERSEILRKAWELMTARLDEFARLITLENGKARADAMGEATYAAEFFRWFAEEAVRADGMITHAPASGARIVVQHKPAGIAVLVTPWNYPAAMGTRKIAPALAAGCPVIIKPASETPLTMLALMPLLEEAGVPKGLVNVLPSKKSGACRPHAARSTGAGHFVYRLHRSGPQAAPFCSRPGAQAGDGTGRECTADRVRGCRHRQGRGWRDARQDAQSRRGLHRRQPLLCSREGRRGVHQQVQCRHGCPEDGRRAGDGIDVGPLVNADTRDKVAAFVEDAVAKGAKLELGGTLPNGKGFFYPPTVLSNVPETADCVHDEIFGPVAAIQTFTDEEDAIRRANDTEYGLVAYVFGRHETRHAGLRAPRLRHGRPEPRSRFRPRRTLRRHQAVGPRPHEGIHGT
jgi:succinate-semialdehyde dehydrogenase/glutarate-semialdehyde dehydrogenase